MLENIFRRVPCPALPCPEILNTETTLFKTIPEEKQQIITSTKFFILAIILVVSYSAQSVLTKLILNSVSLGNKFKHPWVMIFFMFIGQFLMGIVYLGLSFCRKIKPPKKDAIPTSFFSFIYLTIFNFLASILYFISLSWVSSSIHTMLSCSTTIFSAILAVVVLKSKFYRHNFLSIIIIIIGLITVGLASLLFPNCPDVTDSIVGIILIVFSRFFVAVYNILAEKIVKNNKYNPIKAISIQGFWGFLFMVIMLVILNFIPCGSNSFSVFLCASDDSNKFLVENTIYAIKQIGNDTNLLMLTILNLFSCSCFDLIVFIISKYSSSLSRVIISNLSVVLVWVYFLMPINYGCDRESFKWLQLLGFILLIFGTCIHVEVITLPFCGFNLKTVEMIRIRQVIVQMGELKSKRDQLNINKIENIKSDETIIETEKITQTDALAQIEAKEDAEFQRTKNKLIPTKIPKSRRRFSVKGFLDF